MPLLVHTTGGTIIHFLLDSHMVCANSCGAACLPDHHSTHCIHSLQTEKVWSLLLLYASKLTPAELSLKPNTSQSIHLCWNTAKICTNVCVGCKHRCMLIVIVLMNTQKMRYHVGASEEEERERFDRQDYPSPPPSYDMSHRHIIAPPEYQDALQDVLLDSANSSPSGPTGENYQHSLFTLEISVCSTCRQQVHSLD